MGELLEALRLVIAKSDAGWRMTVYGEVDLAAVDVLHEGFDAIIADGEGDVAIDMSSATFCDSVGLGAILSARRRLGEHERRLRVVHASAPVSRLLDLSGTRGLLMGTDPSGGAGRSARPDDLRVAVGRRRT